jgi:hypothetical protein
MRPLTPDELAFISNAADPPLAPSIEPGAAAAAPPAWLLAALRSIRAEDARVAAALALQAQELAAARERHLLTRARLAAAETAR